MKVQWTWFPNLYVKNNPRLIDMPLKSIHPLTNQSIEEAIVNMKTNQSVFTDRNLSNF